MVFPVPVADMVTFFPFTRLLLASFSVIVTVDSEVPSAVKVVGLAETVEALADTGPGVKVAVPEKEIESTVAVIVLVSALVDLRVAVVCPLEFVRVEG